LAGLTAVFSIAAFREFDFIHRLLGVKPKLALVGMVLLLWIPRLVEAPAPAASSAVMVQQSTGGTNSPAVVSRGDVIIGGEAKAPKEREEK
jgi:hypothetical protein